MNSKLSPSKSPLSDILIDGPICFDMPSLKKLLNKAEKPINIRVRPTTSANALFANINNTFSANAFYIRPEDTKYYENAIHTFVFDTEEYIEKEEVIFKIYKNQVVIFCFCSNEMQPCRIWGAKQKTESVALRASTKLKKEQIALFFAFFLRY